MMTAACAGGCVRSCSKFKRKTHPIVRGAFVGWPIAQLPRKRQAPLSRPVYSSAGASVMAMRRRLSTCCINSRIVSTHMFVVISTTALSISESWIHRSTLSVHMVNGCREFRESHHLNAAARNSTTSTCVSALNLYLFISDCSLFDCLIVHMGTHPDNRGAFMSCGCGALTLQLAPGLPLRPLQPAAQCHTIAIGFGRFSEPSPSVPVPAGHA